MEKAIIQTYINEDFEESELNLNIWDLKHSDSECYILNDNIITDKLSIINPDKNKTNIENDKEKDVVLILKGKILKLKMKSKNDITDINQIYKSKNDYHLLNKKVDVKDKKNNHFFVNISFLIKNENETTLCFNINRLYQLSYIKNIIINGEYFSEFLESFIIEKTPKNIKGRVENDIYYLMVSYDNKNIKNEKIEELIKKSQEKEKIKILEKTLKTLDAKWKNILII